jgi:hypothetical protein
LSVKNKKLNNILPERRLLEWKIGKLQLIMIFVRSEKMILGKNIAPTQIGIVQVQLDGIPVVERCAQ